MKRIVSWAAIVILAFSVYLNVFLTLGEMASSRKEDSVKTKAEVLKTDERKLDSYLQIRPGMPYKSQQTETEP